MRRLSRIYEPLAGLAAVRGASHAPFQYVCRTCLRQKSASQLPSIPASAAHLSTSAARAAWITDKLKGLTRWEEPASDVKKDESQGLDYKPAETWDGLDWVGTKQWYEDEMRPQGTFQAFGHGTGALKDRVEIRDELLRTIVEVFTIRSAFPQEWKDLMNGNDMRVPKGIRIGCHPHTLEPVVDFETAEAKDLFLRGVQRQRTNDAVAYDPVSADENGSSNMENEANITTAELDFTFADLPDSSYGKWSSISLDDMSVRFAVAKRVQQRTGIRLSDPQISQSTSVGALFVQLWKPEKPKTLAQGLKGNEVLTNLPNVKIANHRVTFVHKEREVGRWKVIEEELSDRGIPPLGRPDRNARSE